MVSQGGHGLRGSPRSSYKSGAISQIWVKHDIIMKKIRSMFVMNSEKPISEWVQKVEKTGNFRAYLELH